MSIGDFVDRGAWGLEVLVLLACWKLVHPKQVTILRGNHECTTCTHMYGFRSEVLAKYGPKAFQVQFHKPGPAVIWQSAWLPRKAPPSAFAAAPTMDLRRRRISPG